MLNVGGFGPTFTGTVSGRRHAALADTGSKVLIMDEDFARSRGLTVIDVEEYRISLCFADGSTTRTSGVTHGVTWQFGLATWEKNFALDFYILKDAPAEVILSEDFLLRETRAFTEYSDYLIDNYEEEEDREEGYVFVIKKAARLQYKGQFNGVDQLSNDILWDQEKDLRRSEDYRISAIQDATARGAAEATEKLRRRKWDAEFTAQQSSSSTHQNPSQPAALQINSSTPREGKIGQLALA